MQFELNSKSATLLLLAIAVSGGAGYLFGQFLAGL